jgi:hypothetical protein
MVRTAGQWLCPVPRLADGLELCDRLPIHSDRPLARRNDREQVGNVPTALHQLIHRAVDNPGRGWPRGRETIR